MFGATDFRGSGLFLLFALVFFLGGCSEKPPIRESEGFTEGSIYKSDKDAPIPRQLVNMLEKEYIAVYREENQGSPLTDVQLRLQVPRRLLQINVFLKEKTSGTLTNSFRFALPQGGGSIDLADVVNEGKGVFYLDFDFSDLTPEQKERIKVYFVSNAKRFEVHSQVFGAGCGKFFDITSFFHKSIRVKGFELAAADFRYLGQLLGSFFFTFAEPDALFVGSTSFIDSRYQDSHCQFPANL